MGNTEKLCSILPLIALCAFMACMAVMVVNLAYMSKLDNTIDTMWHEIEQVKETNLQLYQFIEGYKNDNRY